MEAGQSVVSLEQHDSERLRLMVEVEAAGLRWPESNRTSLTVVEWRQVDTEPHTVHQMATGMQQLTFQ